MSSNPQNNAAEDRRVIDWLYDQMDGEERERFATEMAENSSLRAHVEELSHVRSVFAQLEGEDPPPAVSARVLHQANLAAQRQRGGLLASIGRWFQPLMAHPGLAAVASLLIVGGVAGTLYVRQGFEVASPASDSAAGAAGELGREIAASPAPEPTLAEGSLGGASVTSDGLLRDERRAEAFADAPSVRLASPDVEKQLRTDEQKKGSPDDVESKGSKDLQASPGFDGNEQDKVKNAPPRKSVAVKEERSQKAKLDAVSSANAAYGLEDAEASADVREFDNDDVSAPRAAAGNRQRFASPPGAPSAQDSEEGFAQAAGPEALVKSPALAPTRWALTQQLELQRAVKKRRCVEVAQIAGDLSDREPTFYRQQVANSADVRPCSAEVKKELVRRVAARKAQTAGGSAASTPQAAPQTDESAEK